MLTRGIEWRSSKKEKHSNFPPDSVSSNSAFKFTPHTKEGRICGILYPEESPSSKKLPTIVLYFTFPQI
jgi:hypothetical protein